MAKPDRIQDQAARSAVTDLSAPGHALTHVGTTRIPVWATTAITTLGSGFVLRILFEAHPGYAVALTWTLIGVAGMTVTSFNFWDSVQDLRLLDARSLRNGLRYLAIRAVFSEMVRLLQMGIVTVIGIISLSSSPVLTREQRVALHIPTWTTNGILVVTGLLLVVVGVLVQAAIERGTRANFYGQGGG